MVLPVKVIAATLAIPVGLKLAEWSYLALLRLFSSTYRDYKALRNKIEALKADPSMSDLKWKDWLPVCRFADEYLSRKVLIFPHSISLDAAVQKLLRGEEEEIPS